MDNKSKLLEESLPRNCCTFCSHLSLEGPDENYRYYIKCIVNNCIPNPRDYCKYFDQENTNLKTSDLDNLYLDFLETCLRVKYEDYLKSLHWQVFKEKMLEKHNYCCSTALLIVIVIYIVIQIKSSDVQPFIYFQF